MFSKHKEKLLVGLVVALLAVGLVFGVSTIFADGPTEPAGEVVLAAGYTGDPPPDDGSAMNCIFCCERVLPSNECVRWHTDCEWKDVGAEESPNYILVCTTCSSCGRTRKADFVGTAASWGFYEGPAYAGWYGGADNLALAKFGLAGFPTSEIEKVILSFEGINLNDLGDTCDDVVFKVDILSYSLSYTWEDWGYQNYVQDYVVLAPVAKVTGHYLRAVTEEDGTTPALGFRFSDERVSELEKAIARSESNPSWSLFIRVSLAEPPTEGNCLLKVGGVRITIP